MFTNSTLLPTPKQNGVPYVGRCTWYPYYAGFSPVFVDSILGAVGCDATTPVCDPWNGAGTTTQTAFDRGIPCFGFDLNPVMTRVATARTLLPPNASNVQKKHDLVFARAKRCRSRVMKEGDPLTNWFGDELVLAIRDIEKAAAQVRTLKPVKALFDAAMFRSMQLVLHGLRSSNPTWVRQPSGPSERIETTRKEFLHIYREQVREMIDGLASETTVSKRTRSSVEIRTASATDLPLPDESIRLVVGSPPYCTRIDYAVTTSVELAFLGIDIHGKDRSFRHKMTGTSTIRKTETPTEESWGATCKAFLRSVRHHPSKASQGYYFKTHIQYFDDLFQSLFEIHRVLKQGGDGVLVVQDSYYKEIHNDLPRIVEEMVSNLNMSVVRRDDFPVSLDMGRVNPRASKSRLKRKPVESVIHFRKTKRG